MANPSGNYHQWRSQWRNTFELFFPTWKWCWVLLVGPWDIIFNLTLRVLHLNHETRGVLRSNNLFGMHFEPQALKSNGIMIATCISRFTRMVIRITNPEKMKIDFKQNPKSSYDVTAKLISESNGLRSNSFFLLTQRGGCGRPRSAEGQPMDVFPNSSLDEWPDLHYHPLNDYHPLAALAQLCEDMELAGQPHNGS